MERDPFDILMEAGSSPETALLLGMPVLLAGIVAIVYLILWQLKRQKEARELEQAVEEEERLSAHQVEGEGQDPDSPAEKDP